MCPQLFRFSGTDHCERYGNAVYQWEFSNGVKTNPVTVPLKDSGQAVVQGNVELAQSTEGWGQLQVLSPVPLASNRAAAGIDVPGGATDRFAYHSTVMGSPAMKWVRAFLLGMWSLWNAVKPDRMAASLAFFRLFALVPLLYIALLVAGFFVKDTVVVQQVLEQVTFALGPETAFFVRDLMVSQAQRQTSDSLLISLINLGVLLFVASGLFGALEDILNTIWGNPFPAEHGILAMIRTQFLSFLLVIGVGLMIVLLSATDFLIAVLSRVLDLSSTLGLLNGTLLIVLNILGFGILYRILARKKARWRYIWLGALVATVLFNAGKWLFGWYLQFTNFSPLYAAAGVLAVILVAVYFAALIFLVGAMLIRVVPETHNKMIKNGLQDE